MGQTSVLICTLVNTRALPVTRLLRLDQYPGRFWRFYQLASPAAPTLRAAPGTARRGERLALTNGAQIDGGQIVEQAAAFHARIIAEDVTAEDWKDLRAWLDENPAHRDVFESMDQMAADLRTLGK